MCDPISAAVIMGAGQATSAYGQYQAQKSAHDWQTRQHELNTRAATDALFGDYEALGSARQQLEAQAAQEAWEATRAGRAAAGQTAAAAAASGLTGASVAETQDQFALEYAGSAAVRMKNLKGSQAQILRDLNSARERAHARISSSQPGPSPRFNWLGLAGGLAGTGATAAASMPKSDTKK